jgi:hypothetical protein
MNCVYKVCDMLKNCDFILGDNDSIVIVVPTQFPKDQPLTLQVHKSGILFRSGDLMVGDVGCDRIDILQRLINKAKVGLIEFLHGVPQFPAYITAVANIEVCSEAA